MNTLTQHFNATFPNYSAIAFSGSTSVIEPANAGNGKLYELQLTGITGFSFPHDLASALSSFATKSGGGFCLKNDCDGIIMFEYDGQKYILLIELKSTFSTDEIADAQKQLVGSSIKFVSTLSVLNGFDINDYRIIGIIASFEATAEQLTAVSKKMDVKSLFAVKLNARKKMELNTPAYHNLYNPLNARNITLFYIPVKDNMRSHTVDVTTLL